MRTWTVVQLYAFAQKNRNRSLLYFESTAHRCKPTTPILLNIYRTDSMNSLFLAEVLRVNALFVLTLSGKDQCLSTGSGLSSSGIRRNTDYCHLRWKVTTKSCSEKLSLHLLVKFRWSGKEAASGPRGYMVTSIRIADHLLFNLVLVGRLRHHSRPGITPLMPQSLMFAT